MLVQSSTRAFDLELVPIVSIGHHRKAGTAEFYRDILDRLVKPALGTTKSDKLTRLQVGRLHSSLAGTPFQANRVLAVVGSMYAFAGRAGTCRKASIRRPWDAVTKRAGLTGVRLHDLRHTYASFGASSRLGLPIIGRLLGHTQAATTARCSIPDDHIDPRRSAFFMARSILRDIRSGVRAC